MHPKKLVMERIKSFPPAVVREINSQFQAHIKGDKVRDMGGIRRVFGGWGMGGQPGDCRRAGKQRIPSQNLVSHSLDQWDV
jgi:hypothetical protein